MLRNYYINREFVVSATARRVYRTAASASLGMLVMLVVIRTAGGVSKEYFPIIKVLALGYAIGTALTFVAMAYFLFGFDKSSAFKKAFWVYIMLRIPVLGAALYCFLVYSRSDLVRKTLPEPGKDKPQPA